MALIVAERWFETARVDDDITLLWEPHVHEFLRCNIWHVRGRELDLMIDTGLGISSLRQATRDLIDKPVLAIATHVHADHIGGHYEFDKRLVHRLEADGLRRPTAVSSLIGEAFDALDMTTMRLPGLSLEGPLMTALPHAGYDPTHYAVRPAAPTHIVEDGYMIDTGDRRFEVLHLPGHSPGSIGLFEAATGTLFSGDAIYDGPPADHLHLSDRASYGRSLERLRRLPIGVIHAGHNPSFGRKRLLELADAYLNACDPPAKPHPS